MCFLYLSYFLYRRILTQMSRYYKHKCDVNLFASKGNKMEHQNWKCLCFSTKRKLYQKCYNNCFSKFFWRQNNVLPTSEFIKMEEADRYNYRHSIVEDQRSMWCYICQTIYAIAAISCYERNGVYSSQVVHSKWKVRGHGKHYKCNALRVQLFSRTRTFDTIEGQKSASRKKTLLQYMYRVGQ